MDIPQIEALLAEDDWIRRLAGRLVSDPNTADDLAQDAWVAALDPSSAGRSVRPWLGGVLRNLVRSSRRSERRRVRRESSVARDEALPSTAELVEDVTLRQEVASVLLALDEPYRSTLYLHFFKDLSLKQIAQRTGVPSSTVHDRMHRGLQLMRVHMDSAHGGDRRAWALALLPLAAPTGGSTPTAMGGLLMNTSVKLVASTLIIGGALGIWIQTSDSRGVESLEAVSAARGELPVAGELPAHGVVDLTRRGDEPSRAEVGADAPAVERPESVVEAAPKTMTLKGRVIDTSQQPIAGLDIGFHSAGEDEMQSSTTTDASGRFSVERESPPASTVTALFARLSGGELVVRDPLFTTLAIGIVGPDELVVVVEPMLDFAGRVIDAAGEPVEGARVSVRVRQSLYREIGLTQFASFPEAGTWTVRTDHSGAFAITRACGGEHLFIDVNHPAHTSAEIDLPDHALSAMLIQLQASDEAIDVTGRVIDAAGAAVARAQVSMGNRMVLSDHDGAFTVHWNPREAVEFRPFWEDDDSRRATETRKSAALHIAALKAGYAPVRIDVEAADLASPILLQLGPRPLSISGKVRDEAGKPLSGIVVWAKNLTPFGKRVLRQGEQATQLPTTVEEQLRGGKGARGVTSDASGSFELDGLMPKAYEIELYDPASACYGQGATIEAGAKGVDLVLRLADSVVPVAGRIVSASGRPLPGILLHVQRSGAVGGLDDPHASPPESLTRDQTTDEEGGFDFPGLATDGTTLRLFGEGIFFHFVQLSDYGDLANLEIVVPLLCELQIDLEDDPDLADRFQVLDEDEELLTFVVSFGALGNTMNQTGKIEAGRTGVLRVPETARTLVLLDEEGEVTRRPLKLDYERRTILRP